MFCICIQQLLFPLFFPLFLFCIYYTILYQVCKYLFEKFLKKFSDFIFPFNLTAPNGDKQSINDHAAEFDGGSVNGFIQRAIREAMTRDRAKKDGGD